jgi:cation diffusion facilitator CzcD-associated flavoprotein CzcO
LAKAGFEGGGRTMKSHARAVVIGGGIVGVSSAYHLVKRG